MSKKVKADFRLNGKSIRESQITINPAEPVWLVDAIVSLLDYATMPEEWSTVVIDGNEFTKEEFNLILNLSNVVEALSNIALGTQTLIDTQPVTTDEYKENLLGQFGLLIGTMDVLMNTVGHDIDTWATPAEALESISEYEKHKVMNPDIIVPDQKIITGV